MTISATVEDTFFSWVTRRYSSMNRARKRLAYDAKVSVSAAEKYLGGRSMPSAAVLIALMREHPDLAQELLQLPGTSECEKDR